jgi:hypothetical protein
VLARNLTIGKRQVARRAAPDHVLFPLLVEDQLIAEIRPLNHSHARQVGDGIGRLIRLEGYDDTSDLDLVSRHEQAPRAGIKRNVTDCAVGTKRNQCKCADFRVLLVDTRHVNTNRTRLATSYRERTGTKLDAPRRGK